MGRTSRSFSTVAKGTGIFGAILCAGVALAGYRYLFPGAVAPDVIAGNSFRLPWLIVHAGTAATALLVGPWQF